MNAATIPVEFRRFPKRWDVLPFGEAIIDKTGGNPKVKQSDYLARGILPVVDQGQASIAGYVDDAQLACKEELPSILFGDHTRLFKYVDHPFALGADGVKVLVPLAGFDKRFVYHYLQQLRLPEDAGYSRHFKFLRETFVPKPPLDEQKRIAAILDKADAIHRKRKHAIQLADEFLRSVFLDMFGDPVANPKGWKLRRLFEITTKIGSGATPRGGKEAYVVEGISLIRSLNVHDNEFLYEDLARITDQQAADLDNVVVAEGDVLLNITGASVCRCAIVPADALPARVNQHVCIIRPNGSFLTPGYLLHLLIALSYKKKLLGMAGAGGATREALTKGQIEQLEIPWAPLDLQVEFQAISDRIKGAKESMARQADETLFASLSQRAFRGDL